MGECFEFDEGLGVLGFFGRFRPQESGRTKKTDLSSISPRSLSKSNGKWFSVEGA